MKKRPKKSEERKRTPVDQVLASIPVVRLKNHLLKPIYSKYLNGHSVEETMI